MKLYGLGHNESVSGAGLRGKEEAWKLMERTFDMKVLFLTNIPSPYRVDFFQALGKLCSLTVLYELPGATDRDSSWKREIGKKSYREIFLKPVFKQVSSAYCPEVKKFLKDPSYDIIVVGGYSTPTGMAAIRYLKRKKKPYFLNSDGGLVPAVEKAWKKQLKTKFIGGAAGYLSTGAACDAYLMHYGALREKIYRYPFTSVSAADLAARPVTAKERIKIREKLGITEEKVILSVGNFIPRKGFDILMRAVGVLAGTASVPGLYLIGGTEIPEYAAIRESLGLENVHYIPFLDKEGLKEYYAAADLFVLPTREDIWGLVINEAMAAGLPVITTDNCVAGTELLEASCIVPAENVDALAEKIAEFLENPQLLRIQSERNLAKMQDYTIENMAKVHAEIFERCGSQV